MSNKGGIFQQTQLDDHYTKIIFNAYVVSTKDDFCSGEIKCRIDNIDSDVLDEDLPKCFPLLPLNINIKPKIGERVRVIFYEANNATHKSFQSIRLYVSAYSSYQTLANDPFHYSANSHEPNGFIRANSDTKNAEKSLGLYPTDDDVALMGKDNADIFLKPSEILLRVGKHVPSDVNTFNTSDVGYIQMRHGIPDLVEETVTKNVTKEIILPSENEIVVTENEGIYNIELKDINDGKTITTVTASSVQEAKTQIRDITQVYERYLINTKLSEFDSIPKTFSNRKTITEQVETKVTKTTNTNSGSVINIVADRINLLSHESIKNFNMTSQPNYINIDDQSYINTNAFSIVLGEVLNEFLEIIQDAFYNHTHPYPNLPPTRIVSVEKVKNFDLEQLLSKHIKVTD